MKTLTIEIKNNKAENLIRIFQELKLLDVISEQEVKNLKAESMPLPKKKGDFFKLFGIWKGRDITLEDIRKKAWPIRR